MARLQESSEAVTSMRVGAKRFLQSRLLDVLVKACGRGEGMCGCQGSREGRGPTEEKGGKTSQGKWSEERWEESSGQTMDEQRRGR
jgi:hypothetical protein